MYKEISRDNYQSFKNWSVWPRQDYYVFDHGKGEHFARLLVIKTNNAISIRSFNPGVDSTIIPIDKYPVKTLKALGIDKDSLYNNIKIYLKNDPENISYLEKLNGVAITKNNFTFINLFSDTSHSSILSSYVKINRFWYYYKR